MISFFALTPFLSNPKRPTCIPLVLLQIFHSCEIDLPVHHKLDPLWVPGQSVNKINYILSSMFFQLSFEDQFIGVCFTAVRFAIPFC